MKPGGALQGDARAPVDSDGIVGSVGIRGELRNRVRHKHYRIRNAQACLHRAKRYIPYQGERNRKEMGGAEIVASHNHLAVDRNVDASIQYPALSVSNQRGWQCLFPARSTAVYPRSGTTRRHHPSESSIQRALKKAISAAGIHEDGRCRTLRAHSRR